VIKRSQVLRTPVRGFATEMQLKLRIATVKNVEKITSTMKMVATSKLKNSQAALDIARVFNDDLKKTIKDPKEADSKNQLFIGLASDGGLCGAVNSTVVRAMRDNALQKKDVDKTFVFYGEKARKGLERAFVNDFAFSYNEIGKNKKLSFKQVCQMIDPITQLKFEDGSVFYQEFQSMISYQTVQQPFACLEKFVELNEEDLQPYMRYGRIDLMENLYDYRLASSMFQMFAETDASTLSSRMNAMENSSKNAGEMLDALTLQLNRTRQARITTELIEIISGASSLEDAS